MQFPNVIAMFGNREGRSDAEGIAACSDGVKRIAPLAEEHGVTICVELLNSKIDHRDYRGDHTAFGVEVINVDSRRVKLLYDIYHMQIMEGDVIRTIRDNIAHIAHPLLEPHSFGAMRRQRVRHTNGFRVRSDMPSSEPRHAT